MVIDGKIIAAARCDLNEGVFVSRNVERLTKNGTGSGSCTGRAVKQPAEPVLRCSSHSSGATIGDSLNHSDVL
jgi:hypothetical protein